LADKHASSPACPINEPRCEHLDELLQLRRKVARLKQEARTDALTGLFNYRHFEQLLSQEMERVRRSGLPMVLVLCDLDHFKEFNDTHGHEAGNRMLQKVARIIDQQLRQLDTACRYGGEEFALILPATSLAQAATVAERIRAQVAAAQLDLPPNKTTRVTLSLGLACFTSACTLHQTDLIARADQQLYRAKQTGRNRVAAPDYRRSTTDTNLLVSADEKAALFARPEDDAEGDGS